LFAKLTVTVPCWRIYSVHCSQCILCKCSGMLRYSVEIK